MSRHNAPLPDEGPVVPASVRIAAMVVAVAATTGLLWMLFNQTEGPAPVLRTFAEAMRDRNCEGSYDLLDPVVRRQIDMEPWCELLPALSDRLDPGFRVERMRLRDGVAHLTIRGRLGRGPQVWRMRRHDRSWLVLGAPGGFELAPEPEPEEDPDEDAEDGL